MSSAALAFAKQPAFDQSTVKEINGLVVTNCSQLADLTIANTPALFNKEINLLPTHGVLFI